MVSCYMGTPNFRKLSAHSITKRRVQGKLLATAAPDQATRSDGSQSQDREDLEAAGRSLVADLATALAGPRLILQ